jgi:hypothetical protein
MSKLDRVIIPLRILLVLLFVGFLVAELLSVPGQFSHLAQESPELGAWPWVLMTLGILELVGLQIVIVCTWILLGKIKSDRIFSPESFVWVDVIVWTMTVGWLLFAGVAAALTAYLYFTPELRDPGTPILLFGMVLTGGVVVLTVVVMRALLRQAATLRSELEEVI